MTARPHARTLARGAAPRTIARTLPCTSPPAPARPHSICMKASAWCGSMRVDKDCCDCCEYYNLLVRPLLLLLQLRQQFLLYLLLLPQSATIVFLIWSITVSFQLVLLLLPRRCCYHSYYFSITSISPTFPFARAPYLQLKLLQRILGLYRSSTLRMSSPSAALQHATQSHRRPPAFFPPLPLPLPPPPPPCHDQLHKSRHNLHRWACAAE